MLKHARFAAARQQWQVVAGDSKSLPGELVGVLW
jgi:hypothetical protein